MIPVPMVDRPYATKNTKAPKIKPLNISEPEGKNFTITGQTVHWGNWCFHVDTRLSCWPATFNSDV